MNPAWCWQGGGYGPWGPKGHQGRAPNEATRPGGQGGPETPGVMMLDKTSSPPAPERGGQLAPSDPAPNVWAHHLVGKCPPNCKF